MRIQGDKYPANFTKDNAFAMISQYGTNLRISSVQPHPRFFPILAGSITHSSTSICLQLPSGGRFFYFLSGTSLGYFPAAALAWRVSEESFMKGLEWLDDLKLRASYGQVGNDAISSDQMSQLWAAETDILNQYAIGNKLIPAYDLASDQMANRNLKWETTITRNIGIDYTLLKNRIWEPSIV